MKKHPIKFHIGPRTWKTAAAVLLSLVVAQYFGTTDSRLVFAMLGAMAAMEPTFKASLESSLTQIVGVAFGALIGMGLQMLPVHGLVAAGIGIVAVITLYNAFGIRFSPGLPCLIVMLLCMDPEANPYDNTLGRIWDTAIGLIVGMVINTLVFPYDNRRQIRETARSLDREVIAFLEDMFDGDDHLPDAGEMAKNLALLAHQLSIFSEQRWLKNAHRDLETFQTCEQKARELLARMTVLSQVERIGRLSDENRRSLKACGADIRDQRPLDSVMERDVVTNYHVRQILKLRRELLEVLKR